jgi:D-alanine-D-alanine ligase
MGSSVGIAKVTTAPQLAPALAAAFDHDQLVIVEAMSAGMEIECSLLGDAGEVEASVPGEIVLESEWYDYAAKYEPGGMRLVVPARIPHAVAQRVRALGAEAFRRTGCSGMARCDFFVEDPTGARPRVLVNELNTIPGFTETSVYAKLFEASGLAYPQLLDRLLELALERHERERRLGG